MTGRPLYRKDENFECPHRRTDSNEEDMAEEKIVIVLPGENFWNGPQSTLLRGDPDYDNEAYWDLDKSQKCGKVLPALLMEGWRIKTICPGGEKGWMVVVERS